MRLGRAKFDCLSDLIPLGFGDAVARRQAREREAQVEFNLICRHFLHVVFLVPARSPAQPFRWPHRRFLQRRIRFPTFTSNRVDRNSEKYSIIILLRKKRLSIVAGSA